MLKIAVIGFGSRGSIYSGLYKNEASIVAVCDIVKEKLELAQKEYGISEQQTFLSSQDFFKQDKLADLLIVATPDAFHKEHALAALKKGYDIQLEKPIACSEADCREIYKTAKELNRKVFVCHVLRYAPFFSEIKRELDTGDYGNIVTINLTENVDHLHQAHSYVRGNWRNSETSSPMIIAKCCHDLDILAWLMKTPCEAVSSMGSLIYYKKENAPKNSTERCYDCPVKNDCIYDAERYYLSRFHDGVAQWPTNILAVNPTMENVKTALKTGPYGRCVYKCDNNVVDHQVVNMSFKGGTTAHLTMTAFSKDNYREIHVHCDKGEIYGNMVNNILTCNVFGKGSKTIDISTFNNSALGHGGGDHFMVQAILSSYANQNILLTTIENSMISHIMGFAAEKSRLNNGAVVNVKL